MVTSCGDRNSVITDHVLFYTRCKFEKWPSASSLRTANSLVARSPSREQETRFQGVLEFQQDFFIALCAFHFSIDCVVSLPFSVSSLREHLSLTNHEYKIWNRDRLPQRRSQTSLKRISFFHCLEIFHGRPWLAFWYKNILTSITQEF